MKMLLRRSQRRTAVFGKAVFILDVRANFADDEAKAIEQYVPRETCLFEHTNEDALKPGLANMFKPLVTTISIADLENGKRFECKDIVEMLGAEEAIKKAGETLTYVLRSAMKFGGEEVLTF